MSAEGPLSQQKPEFLTQLIAEQQKYALHGETGENYAPRNGRILSDAIKAVEHMIEDQKKFRKEVSSEIRTRTIKLGEEDGEIGVEVVRVDTEGNNGPTIGTEKDLFLGLKLLESGVLPEKISSIVTEEITYANTNEGNEGFSVHFVGSRD